MLQNIKFDIKFFLTQFRFGRKWYKGTYYLIYVIGVPLTNQVFWSEYLITSNQSRVLEIETY